MLPKARLFFIFLFLIALNFVNGNEIAVESSQKTPKLCLTMIVRNESKIIQRCLNEVKDLIDAISICDTGSTDNTVEIIKSFMEKNNIPGKVHSHEWKNFGHNRTLSAKAAVETLKELGFPLEKTYFLLIDADMILKREPLFKREDLVEDAYALVQKNSAYCYYNTRLIRASLPWECVGVTHEYWACKASASEKQLSTLYIDDRDDGGCKSDKFTRDLKLLLQGLEEEPDNVRYMFYCAQTYWCLGQKEEAIRWYKARIDKGGWREEIWYSKLMLGECYEALGYWNHALQWYLDAYQTNPDRAETLQKIAMHYRIGGENHLSFIFANHGKKIPYPKNQYLFLYHPTYEYQFDEEISISGFYTRFKDEGYAALNRLLLQRNIPDHTRENAYSNMIHYVQNLTNVHFQSLQIDLKLNEETHAKYFTIDPCIQKTEEGYSLFCSLREEDHTKNRDFLIRYNESFSLLSQQEIIKNFPEDLAAGERSCLTPLENSSWLLKNCVDPVLKSSYQTLCKLSSQSQEAIHLEKPLILKASKKLLPFTYGPDLLGLAFFDPLEIFKINKETGECETLVHYEPDRHFSSFRHAAPPIAFDEGFLLIIHEVTSKDREYYTHRFVYLDKNLIIKKLSLPFTFLHKGVELCGGLAIDHSQQNCILSICKERKEAYLCTISLDTIRSMLLQI